MIRFAHTNIISNNWRSLAQFYVDTFGCEIIPPERDLSGDWLDRGTGLENARLTGIHLKLPGYDTNGPTLEIFQYDEIDPEPIRAANKRGFGHIAFEVDQIEVVYQKLLKNGGTECGNVGTKHIVGVGTVSFLYARDPEGNLIELQTWDRGEIN